jgi:hypothetical protein
MVRNRRWSVGFSVLVALAGLYAIGCSRPPGALRNIAFTYESDPKSPRAGLNTFTVTLTRGSGQPLAGAHVSLEADMSHAGMAPVFAEAGELAPGRYQGTIDLNMRGDWVVLFHIKLTSGETFDRQVELRNLQAT